MVSQKCDLQFQYSLGQLWGFHFALIEHGLAAGERPMSIFRVKQVESIVPPINGSIGISTQDNRTREWLSTSGLLGWLVPLFGTRAAEIGHWSHDREIRLSIL